MKFAKELEQELVSEWRPKYLDYRIGKKKLKAVGRALRNINQTPKTPKRRPADFFTSSPLRKTSFGPSPFSTANSSTFGGRRHGGQNKLDSTSASIRNGASQRKSSVLDPSSSEDEGPLAGTKKTPPMKVPDKFGPTTRYAEGNMNYGSFIPTPPAHLPPIGPPTLELPDPAMGPDDATSMRHGATRRPQNYPASDKIPFRRTASTAGDAYEVGRTHTPSKLSATLLPKTRHLLHPRRVHSTPGGDRRDPTRPLIKRLFSLGGHAPNPRPGSSGSIDVPLEAYKDFDLRQAEFFTFLDMELEKVESFYKAKENEANERLHTLKAQLHEMRDRRLEEVVAEQVLTARAKREAEEQGMLPSLNGIAPSEHHNGNGKFSISGIDWARPIESALGNTTHPHVGKTTRAMQKLGSPPGPQPQLGFEQQDRAESRQDFVRRRNDDNVPYRSAKRKLKLAMQEFYRGMELLKSYALLNRTAFRKIGKKYDKTVMARPAGRYMSEKVNKAWFVQSEALESYIQAVEDLYARYFERGNHKIAVGKLRSRTGKHGDYSASLFRDGALIAAGLVLGIQGVVYGAEDLKHPDPVIYAGYFLALFLFLLFSFDCRVFSMAKINYVFIFEFDTRHALDWRQLLELPCLLFALEGLFLWLNFQRFGPDKLFIYYPIILIALTAIILFFPARILYHRSRKWWLYSNWRLVLAGLYPVEFRDFFLGDMYCSQTYTMGNIELFFCLYVRDWRDPAQCNSSHSRLLGFFQTLPGIWRALQCLRRYYDTRNAFPHLVNCGKYSFTILYYMTLSLYRMDKNAHLLGLFITCATINSIYCSIWDLAMDWSLCNPYAKYPFLRDTLGFRRPSMYYLAMIIDPILRFNWIFYAIYRHDVQHSAVLSFFVAFSEVLRRGMWTLFRVENEHCTNVGRFRASRDVALPYHLRLPASEPASPTIHELDEEQSNTDISNTAKGKSPVPSPAETARRRSSGTDLERATTTASQPPGSGSLRQRKTRAAQVPTTLQRGFSRIGTLMTEAHAQDFERKRKPVVDEGHGGDGSAHGDEAGTSDEDEEDGEQEDEVEVRNSEDIIEARAYLASARGEGQGGGDGVE
ncbi:MAG: hypothetical protein M1812_000346 [Candelaria pacifica]|nr:MAG: hypothetical protein M1812_000346 [Candelaria pacifica]